MAERGSSVNKEERKRLAGEPRAIERETVNGTKNSGGDLFGTEKLACEVLDFFASDRFDDQTEQSEADEPRPRAPLEHARVTRHPDIMKQRHVFDPERLPSAVEMIAVIETNIAVDGMPRGLEAPQLRLHDAPLKSLQVI